MTRRGNLLRNGNFVLGTTEDWVIRPYDLGDEGASLTLSTPGFFGSNYKGDFYCPYKDKKYYLMYDKQVDFESSASYLYSLLVYLDMYGAMEGVLYGLEDNGYFIDKILFGHVSDRHEWIWLNCILRRLDNLSNFKVGLMTGLISDSGFVFVGCAKLIPLASAKDVFLKEYLTYDNVSSTFVYNGKNACLGRCKLYSVLSVSDVSGTDPQLETIITIYPYDCPYNSCILPHTPFTTGGSQTRSIELPQLVNYNVTYNISGTNPSFTIRHLIMITPL